MPTIASIQIGQPQDLGDAASNDPMNRPWRSGFFKRPVAGPVQVDYETLVGDGVDDRVNHGGPDKAILGYSAAHYPLWRAEIGLPGDGTGGAAAGYGVDAGLGADAAHGAFGENLTIDGQAEGDVCVGDVYAAGDVVLEVSQPRQPCWKLGRRWRRKDMPARVMASGRTGWYFRVRHVGHLAAALPVRLLDRPHQRLTIVALNDMMYGRRDATAEAAECAALSADWRDYLRHKLG
jgi:MOSC domain-containing protein YiiM